MVLLMIMHCHSAASKAKLLRVGRGNGLARAVVDTFFDANARRFRLPTLFSYLTLTVFL